MSENPKKPDDTAGGPTPSSEPTREKSMRELFLEAGIKVREPRGEGFIIPMGGPIRQKP